ncbi:uncharacterized protein LOC141717638 [Apium graveolens]|uniref:uncharacterized protein LOC141717638 n=1 Tax=Apium graveolens TaxID=4045 RepID=UPI003D792EE1
MDRSWLKEDRRTQEFKLGVDVLLNFAFLNGFKENKISCPCLRCAHSKSWNAQTVKDHLYQYGIDETYTCWIWHGEPNSVQSHVVSEQDTSKSSVDPTNMRMGQDIIDDEDISLDSSDFMNHVQGENEPLYPGCESFTKMRALVKLYNLKAKHGISDKCFFDVLLLLASMLPKGKRMPSSFGEAKKTLCTLGMDYEKIHACPNDCLLYRGERDEDETICRICGASRWKLNKKEEEVEGIPAKVLWYFPLIPRLRNLFNTTQIAKDMTWHKTERQNDGKIKHPADSKTWKDVDQRWPEFAAEARNLRLALSSDGFNPFHGSGSDHSTWLATYKKTVVMRYHRWMPRNYPYRRKKSAFDNTMEKLSEPIPLTGEELEYWKFLPVRHTIDVMHIEKTICEALTGTLLNIPGKTKDRESVHIDMAKMGIRMELRPKNPGKKRSYRWHLGTYCIKKKRLSARP